MRTHEARTPFAVALVAGAMALAACSSGALLPIGGAAPDRALRDQAGTERTLASFRGRPLVVYFYPRDGTPGCTREACAFRDAWDRYAASGVGIVGVSSDDVASHARFAREHELQFPLLADEDGALAEAFGVKRHLGMDSRVTFVLDAAGVIRAVYRDVDPGVHADEVLADMVRLGLLAQSASPPNP